MSTIDGRHPDPRTTVLVRLTVPATAAAAGLGVVGAWPTTALAGTDAIPAMMVGLGAALLGAWLGALMPVIFLSRDPRVFLNGLLANLAIRFMVPMAAALILRVWAILPVKPTLLWIAIGQVVLLAVDAAVLVRLVRAQRWESKA